MRIFRSVLPFLVAMSCALAATESVHAQNRILGVKGGVTLASADIDDVGGIFDAENRTGWGIGAFLTLGSGLVSFQPELNFVENGFKATSASNDQEVKLRYFAPAVLLRVGLPLGVVRPGVFGGMGIGLEAGCKIDDEDCEDSDFALETEPTDPTGIFGADLDIFLGATATLRTDIRYAIGFSDIEKTSDVWTEIKNRAWAISVGLGYRF
jgi:hypothetical protein